MVYEIHKLLQGLKQATCQWFGKVSNTLLTYWLKKSFANNSLFTMITYDYQLLVLVYVVDLVIIGNNSKAYADFKLYP